MLPPAQYYSSNPSNRNTINAGVPSVFDRVSTTNVLKQLVQMTDPDKQLSKNHNYGSKGSGSK